MGVRRELRFKTLNEARAELDRLEKVPVVTIGNWSYYQILTHLNKGSQSMHDFLPFLGGLVDAPLDRSHRFKKSISPRFYSPESRFVG